MAEKKLTPEMQIFVIQQLAIFERPETVKQKLFEVFNMEVALPAIFHYQITSPKFPEKWRELFTKTRESFLTNINEIPIANKAFRLKELNKIYDKEASSKLQNTVAMRETLEHAAKESGDAFTNRREISGANGNPIETTSTVIIQGVEGNNAPLLDNVSFVKAIENTDS